MVIDPSSSSSLHNIWNLWLPVTKISCNYRPLVPNIQGTGRWGDNIDGGLGYSINHHFPTSNNQIEAKTSPWKKSGQKQLWRSWSLPATGKWWSRDIISKILKGIPTARIRTRNPPWKLSSKCFFVFLKSCDYRKIQVEIDMMMIPFRH